jgi:hypothetical protein
MTIGVNVGGTTFGFDAVCYGKYIYFRIILCYYIIEITEFLKVLTCNQFYYF